MEAMSTFLGFDSAYIKYLRRELGVGRPWGDLVLLYVSVSNPKQAIRSHQIVTAIQVHTGGKHPVTGEMSQRDAQIKEKLRIRSLLAL